MWEERCLLTHYVIYGIVGGNGNYIEIVVMEFSLHSIKVLLFYLHMFPNREIVHMMMINYQEIFVNQE